MAKKPPPDTSHPFREKRPQWPEDIRLRANGFTIYSRKKGKEPEWKLGSEVFTHDEAIELCNETEE